MSLRERKGFFGRLTEKIADVINVHPEIDESLFDDIEEVEAGENDVENLESIEEV